MKLTINQGIVLHEVLIFALEKNEFNEYYVKAIKQLLKKLLSEN